MRVKGIIEEDFTNFKLPSMFINTCFCDFKCCTESNLGIEVCQNAPLAQADTKEIPDTVIYQHFSTNPITKAVVIGGMEPMLQIDEVESLIRLFRASGDKSPFVRLRKYKFIIVKFGRFIPDRQHRYDNVLGIELSSDNQYAEQIS